MTAADGWLSDVTFWVDGVAAGGSVGPPPPGGGSGSVPTGAQGFSLSREEAQKALDDFEKISNKLRDMQGKANSLVTLERAADDPASSSFHLTLANGGGRGGGAFDAGYEHIQREIAFFEVLVARLKTALGEVAGADEDAEAQIGSAGALPGEDKGYLE
jgi:hypothetical protein